MAIFKKTQAGDTTVYTNVTDGRQVKAEDVPAALKEELDLADFGTEIDSDTVTQGEGDGVVDANGEPVEEDKVKEDVKEDKKPSVKPSPKPRQTRAKADQNADDEDAKAAEREQRINPYRKDVPQTEEGFGFPRKGGKTVDIFDGKTPHTQVRAVANLLVPVNDENYRTKTDAEIYDRLVELEIV